MNNKNYGLLVIGIISGFTVVSILLAFSVGGYFIIISVFGTSLTIIHLINQFYLKELPQQNKSSVSNS